jgi:membrane protein DedA with SNARE-associated domain/rhodanese-related sulfurtransferase
MQQLIALIQEHGLWLVFLNVLAEQAGVPVPAYPTLIIAGAVLTRGNYALIELLVVGALAAVIADTFWYLAGRRYGTRVLRILCRVSLSPDSCVRQTEDIFERFGPASMIFAKFVPGFASVSTALAGAIRLRYWKFVLFDFIGAFIWVGVAVVAGYRFRDAVGDVLDVLTSLGKWGMVIVLLALAAWIAGKWWKRVLFTRQLRMDRVTVEELKTLLDAKDVSVILDVRSALSQEASGRIPGARRIDVKRLAEDLVGVPTDGEVIVYCACPNEASAVKVAEKLRAHGFKRVRPLHGGIDAWIDAGHDVER